MVPLTERELRRLVAVWAKRLGLGHFDIRVEMRAFEDDNSSARCTVSADYDRAKLEFQPWLLKGAPPEDLLFPETDVEAVVVHELLHISFWPLRRARRTLEDTNSLHRDVQAIFEEVWSQREEEAVDRLAVALVRAWPHS